MQYKIENDTLLPAPATFTLPDGRTVSNFSSSPELMTAHGFTMTEEEAQEWRGAHITYRPPVPRTTCTKYELVTVLRERFPELFEALREQYVIDPELQFWWNTVNDLDRDNADFAAAAEKLGVTSEQLDEIFAAVEEF